jgi:hypothetical protein
LSHTGISRTHVEEIADSKSGENTTVKLTLHALLCRGVNVAVHSVLGKCFSIEVGVLLSDFRSG